MLAGKPAIGCWLFMGCPAATEILAQCGFDALIIDHEHSPGSLETAVHQLRAAQGSDASVLLRLADNSPRAVRQALDAGVTGVIAASVENAEQASALVEASLYPPAGRRGLHYTVGRSSGWGVHADEYRVSVEEDLLTVAMIESEKAVSEIPEMARERRLDMLFVGPLDLSASIGCPGDYNNPAFRELLCEFERRTLEAGFLLGGTTLPGIGAEALFARGYSFASVASDVGLLRDAARERARLSYFQSGPASSRLEPAN